MVGAPRGRGAAYNDCLIAHGGGYPAGRGFRGCSVAGIVVVGAGVIGLATGMMLADQVTSRAGLLELVS